MQQSAICRLKGTIMLLKEQARVLSTNQSNLDWLTVLIWSISSRLPILRCAPFSRKRAHKEEKVVVCSQAFDVCAKRKDDYDQISLFFSFSNVVVAVFWHTTVAPIVYLFELLPPSPFSSQTIVRVHVWCSGSSLHKLQHFAGWFARERQKRCFGFLSLCIITGLHVVMSITHFPSS